MMLAAVAPAACIQLLWAGNSGSTVAEACRCGSWSAHNCVADTVHRNAAGRGKHLSCNPQPTSCRGITRNAGLSNIGT